MTVAGANGELDNDMVMSLGRVRKGRVMASSVPASETTVSVIMMSPSTFYFLETEDV